MSHRSPRTARPQSEETSATSAAAAAAPSRTVVLATLAAIVAFGAALRALPAWRLVFQAGRVVLASTDPWVHARQVDVTLAHFPWPTFFDPYRLFPGGQAMEPPLFPWAMAAAAWLLGLGRPSPRLVDTVLALTPPIAGALLALPAFALGRRLAGLGGGLLAAAVVAVVPGQALDRSLLGYCDHHVAESLLSLAALAAFAALGERGRDAPGDPRALAGTAALAGVALAAYLLVFARGAFLVAVVTAWAVAVLVREHRDAGDESLPVGATARRLAVAIALAFAVAALLVAPIAARVASMRLDLPALAGGAAAVAASAEISRALAARGRGRAALVATIGALAAAVALAAWRLAPAVVHEALVNLARLRPSPTSETIGEARPLLQVAGPWSLVPLWRELHTLGPLGLCGLVWLLHRGWRDGRRADLLVALWAATALAMTFGQVRFGYYLGPAAAVVAAAFVVAVIVRGLPRAGAIAAAAALAVLPSVPIALASAAAHAGGPQNYWLDALDWLRTATPEPFGDPRAYLVRYPPRRDDAPPGPRAGWGVLAWADAGYWITRVAHRVPLANPTQSGAAEVASLLLATDPAAAGRRLDALGARYLVLDATLVPTPRVAAGVNLGILPALARWANVDLGSLVRVVLERGADGRDHPTVLFTPTWYRTLLFRLYVGGGKALEGRDGAWVVELAPATVEGRAVTRLVARNRFATPREAEAFAAARGGAPRFRVVGLDPWTPCTPLAAAEGYLPVHRAPQLLVAPDGRVLTMLAVFERRPGHR